MPFEVYKLGCNRIIVKFSTFHTWRHFFWKKVNSVLYLSAVFLFTVQILIWKSIKVWIFSTNITIACITHFALEFWESVKSLQFLISNLQTSWCRFDHTLLCSHCFFLVVGTSLQQTVSNLQQVGWHDQTCNTVVSTRLVQSYDTPRWLRTPPNPYPFGHLPCNDFSHFFYQ